MPEVMLRVKDVVAAPPQIRRRAHAIEHQREPGVLVAGWVEAMERGIDALVTGAAPVQFLKQRPEPVRMLVINANRFRRHVVLLCKNKKARKADAFRASNCEFLRLVN